MLEFIQILAAAEARSDLEVKHFKERQGDRKLLSDRASKELVMRVARDVEIFIRDQKAVEDKECVRKEEEARQHLELEKAVHESREKQMALKQEQKRKEKEKKKEAERRKKIWSAKIARGTNRGISSKAS